MWFSLKENDLYRWILFKCKRVFQFGCTEKTVEASMVFTVYELSNTFFEVTDSLVYSSSMEDE